MAYRIVVTQDAKHDLREIHRYISADNPVATHHTRIKLVHQLKLIANFAHAGRMVPEIGREDIRELIRNPYRITYRLNPRQKQIEVLRFWHSARGTPHFNL